MATPKQFRRRGRWSLIAGVVFASLTFGVAYAFADQVQGDSDVVTANIQNNPITVNLAPGGTTNVTAGVQIKSQGSTHVAFPVEVNVTTENLSGTTVGSPATTPLSVNTYGDAGEQSTTFPVTAPSTGLVCGQNNLFQAKLHFTATTDLGALVGGNAADFVTVNVNVQGPACAPVNQAPMAGSITGTTPVLEGSNHSYADTTATDPENDTLAYTWLVLGNASISGGQGTNTVSLDFTDGPSTVTLHLDISDGHGHTVSPTDFSITENNVAPSPATPTWGTNPINCTDQATLTGISWTDPVGLTDRPFSGQVNWGDSSSTPFSTINALSLSNQNHTYAPGTYQASVDVTDKDGDKGSSSNSVALTVNQVYTVRFLQPLDGSTPAKVIGNTVKKGRVVPVKAIITDACTGNYVTNPAANVTIVVKDATFVPTASDAVETFSDAGSSSGQTQSFRWTSDSSAPGGGFWIYNLDTNGFGVGTAHNVYVKVGSTQASTNYADVVTTK